MLTHGKTVVHQDAAGAFKICDCGTRFPAEFNSRGQMTSRRLCDDCRDKRAKRSAAELPNTQGVLRCADCSALVGLDWGSVTHLDELGRCADCAAWGARTLVRDAESRRGVRFAGGLRFESPLPAWRRYYPDQAAHPVVRYYGRQGYAGAAPGFQIDHAMLRQAHERDAADAVRLAKLARRSRR